MQQTRDDLTDSIVAVRCKEVLAGVDFDLVMQQVLSGKASAEQLIQFGLVDGFINLVAQMSIHTLTVVYSIGKDMDMVAAAAQRLVDSFKDVNLPPYLLQACANQVQAVLDTLVQQHNDRIIASGEQDEAI